MALPLAARGARGPETSAFDLSLLDERPTPAELFFVREHFPAPRVSAHGWKVAVTGAAGSPYEIPLDELAQQPGSALAATLECAENPPGGGLVSHADWEGLPLAMLLARAQPEPQARFVRLTGADGFSRTLPLEKALDPDTLLVHRMNGKALPPQHGGPLRAAVPGWYGMDWVKWLTRIELTRDAPLIDDYRRLNRSLLAGVVPGERISAVKVKSVFARPVDGAILSGRSFVLRGAAWAGVNLIRSVEVSTDGGASWIAARLASPRRYCWSLWEREWRIPGPGAYELMVRATDDQSNTQPLEPDSRRADAFEQNWRQRIRVTVL